MPASESSTLQGWLLKQKHGLCRSWLKRYFVLHGRELSYYRNETDKEPQNILDLDHYTISFKKQSRRNCIFVLVAEEHHIQPDYYLQAESKDELDVWVTHLQQHMSTSSVLDKWLDRLDMTCVPPPPPPPPLPLQDKQTTSCTSLHVPTLSYHPHHTHHTQQQHQYHHHHHHRHHSLRSHRSVESIYTFCSLPSVSHRVSFTNNRRPSSQSTHSNSSGSSNLSHASNSTTTTSTLDTGTHYRPANTESSLTTASSSSNGNSNKFFTSRIFTRKHQQQHINSNKQSSLDSLTAPHGSDYSPAMLSPSTPSLLLATCSSSSTDVFDEPEEQEQGGYILDSVGIKQQQALDRHFFSSSSSSPHVYPFLATSIIHPSEYNHDDDPQERLRLRQQQLPRGRSCSSFHYPLDPLGLSSSTDTSS